MSTLEPKADPHAVKSDHNINFDFLYCSSKPTIMSKSKTNNLVFSGLRTPLKLKEPRLGFTEDSRLALGRNVTELICQQRDFFLL